MELKEYTKESGNDYVAFIEGVYYKVNNAVVYRTNKKEVILRNTFTGKEQKLKENINKKDATKFLKEFIKKGYKRI